MGVYVLVPGAWLGSWCWQRVTPLLRAAGHEVYPVTLTGLGDRVHLATPETGLETHVQDVVNLLEFEDLREVVLLGHSYSGLVTGSVLHRVPERIRHAVFLAAGIPVDGESFLDGWSDDGRAWLEEHTQVVDGVRRWDVLDDLASDGGDDVSQDDQRWFHAKAVGHPFKSLADPARLGNPAADAVPRTYIRCTGEGDYLPDAVARAGWPVRDIASGHWPMFSRPRELADILLDLG